MAYHQPLTENEEDLSRDTVTKRIKTALQKRSGVSWSVTGGRGTGYGWITITAPPARRLNGGSCMSAVDRKRLAKLLGLPHVGPQGDTVGASYDYYREYIDRAEGREPRKIATPYWD